MSHATLQPISGFAAVVHTAGAYAINVYRNADGSVRRLAVAPVRHGFVRLRLDKGGTRWLPVAAVFPGSRPSGQVPKRIRPVPDWPGYWCDDIGNVYSGRRRTIRILKTGGKGRYASVVLYGDNGRCRYANVHRLVWEAFNGPIAPGLVVRHKDDSRPRDNRVDALAIGTYADNAMDACLAGRKKQKLTELAVRCIRRLVRRGWPRKKVARIFEVSVGTISHLMRRETWRHIGDDAAA
jgi:hypothetical protein